MATTIQIVVAGVLLLAWIWVLGRPLMASTATGSDYRNLDRTSDDRAKPVGPEADDRLSRFRSVADWLRRPGVAWRRQLMLATMFASFASFLLAIALRGRFVVLFLLMTAILGVHLIVASFIGSRMLAAERAVAVTAAKKRVQRSFGMSIRAEQVGLLNASTDEALDSTADSVNSESRSTAFAVAAELASQLATDQHGPVTEQGSEPPAAEAVVEEDESAVASGMESSDGSESDAPADTAPGNEATADVADGAQDTDGDAERAQDTHGDAEDVEDGADSSGPESIFRRATKDEPARERHQAKPIYIESQLDEEGEGFAIKAADQQ